MRRLLVTAASRHTFLLVLRAIALLAALGLATVAPAQDEEEERPRTEHKDPPSFDEFGLRPPAGGDAGHWATPPPGGDGARPERIAPDEDALDPFDERAIELEPDVRIAPMPAPSRETDEPILPPVEEVLRDGPADEAPADPGGIEDEEQQYQQQDESEPEEW